MDAVNALFNPVVVRSLNGMWAAIVLGMGLAKLFENALMVQMFRGWGLRPYMTSIGLLEIGSVLLYLYPPTLRVGFFLLNAFFGGAVATTLQRGDRPWPPLLMLLALWVVAWLRGPHLFRNEEVRSNEWDYLGPSGLRGR